MPRPTNEPRPHGGPPAPGRRSGKRVAVALLAIIGTIVAAAVGLFLYNRVPSGPILAMRAVPDGRVVLLRRGFEARDTVHVALHGARGEHVWSEPLFGVQDAAEPFVVGDFVVVPAKDGTRRASTHVFRLTAGTFVFRAEPPPATVPHTARARYAAVDGRLAELYPGEPGRLVIYDVATGERLHESSAAAGERDVRAEGAVFVVTGASPRALDAATLAPAPIPARVAPPASRARSLLFAQGCVRWDGPSGPATLPLSALDADGPRRTSARLLDAGDRTILSVGGGGPELVLAAVDANGSLHVARVRADEGPIAASRPGDAAGDAVFVRTARRVVGLEAPALEGPRGGAEGFSVRAGVRAAAPCGDSVTR